MRWISSGEPVYNMVDIVNNINLLLIWNVQRVHLKYSHHISRVNLQTHFNDINSFDPDWNIWSLTSATDKSYEEDNRPFFQIGCNNLPFKVNHWQISTGEKLCKAVSVAEPITIQQRLCFGLFFISKCVHVCVFPFLPTHSPACKLLFTRRVLAEQRCRKKFRQADTMLAEHIMGVNRMTQEKRV